MKATFAIVALVALAFVTAASAASPREIYADYADNGRLDKTYSQRDLQRAQNNAAIQGYGNPTVDSGLQGEIEKQLGDKAGVGTVGRSDGTLPFTGVDLALLAVGAGFLLTIGWGLRRLGRARR
jgi:hypothetical protein